VASLGARLMVLLARALRVVAGSGSYTENFTTTTNQICE
jgi:hypothetical protein